MKGLKITCQQTMDVKSKNSYSESANLSLSTQAGMQFSKRMNSYL